MKKLPILVLLLLFQSVLMIDPPDRNLHLNSTHASCYVSYMIEPGRFRPRSNRVLPIQQSDPSHRGAVSLSRHHIIPYNILRGFYNRLATNEQHFRHFFDHVLVVAGSNAGVDLLALEDLSQLRRASLHRLPVALHDHVNANRNMNQDSRETFTREVYTWLPFNIFIGPLPNYRADDPGDNFEGNAHVIVGQPRLDQLRHLQTEMIDYIDAKIPGLYNMSTASPFLKNLNPTLSTEEDVTQNPLELLKAECLERLRNTTAPDLPTGSYCQGTWDGWLCWPDTPAGESAFERCPSFIFGFDPTRTAHKECMSDGEWFKHPSNNKTWSNYTTCVNFDDLEWRENINLIYETGYGISLVAILMSLAILGYFRSLKCARITIHMNLFASFAVNNTLWLVWYKVVIADTVLLNVNPPPCIALHLVLHYFLLSNYSWMLCEGFYLHTVLVSAFISEKRLVKWLIGFGWGSPAIVMFIYGLSRGLAGEDVEVIHCWMNSTAFDFIFIVPVCISMLLNLLFLCNIVRVVLLKLKAPAGMQGNCGPSRVVLQAFRATLLLVPLLGLQYIVTPFKPDPGHPWEHAYEVISAFTASFQGLCVATFFCFFNGEVIAQVKRKWTTIFYSNRPRNNSYTATQVSFVRSGPHIPGEEKV